MGVVERVVREHARGSAQHADEPKKTGVEPTDPFGRPLEDALDPASHLLRSLAGRRHAQKVGRAFDASAEGQKRRRPAGRGRD